MAEPLSEVSTATREVVDMLGGKTILRRPPGSTTELRVRIEEGLPYGSLEALMERLGLTRFELHQVLDIPERTASRRKTANRLHPDESDRLYRLARIAARAVEVLGDAERASAWLHRPNRALGGETPMALLRTDLGSREVEQVLGRIEHGVIS